MSSNGWIGVDLDGTLAHYESFGDGGIGAPIKPMVRRIKHYLKQGKDVRILTARIAHEFGQEVDGEMTIRIQQWCKEHLGQILSITCRKDYHMYMLLDDRAMQVIPNKGILVREELRRAVQALRDIEVDPTDAYLKAAAALSKLDEWSLKLANAE
jgi:hypothetical protein